MRRRWKVAAMSSGCAAILIAALVSTLAQTGTVRLEASASEGQAGGKSTGQVLLNDKPVITFHVASSGVSPIKRAEVVANRLNELFATQVLPNDFVVTQTGGNASLQAKGMTVVTATKADAAALNMTPKKLASFWRNTLVSRMETILGIRSDKAVQGTSSEKDRRNSGSTNRRVATRSAEREPVAQVPTGKKIVPIISLGQGIHIGAAQVVGPRFAVDEVKAVAQLEADFKKLSGTRIRALVPVSTENTVSNLKRIDQVSVSMYGDVDPRKIF